MSAFILKVIALISMVCDHVSYILLGRLSFFNYIGRISFPIFAFQISEGYIHTNNLKKYFLRLFVFALISQAPFMLFKSVFSDNFSLNIFFTLLFGLFSIVIYDNLDKLKTKNKFFHYLYKSLGIFATLILCIIADLLNTDYGAFGVFIIFVFFLLKKYKLLMNLVFIICTILHYLKELLYSPLFETYLLLIIFTLSSLFFINLYNGKKGKNSKYFLYVFYPTHLIFFYALSFLPILPLK